MSSEKAFGLLGDLLPRVHVPFPREHENGPFVVELAEELTERVHRVVDGGVAMFRRAATLARSRQ
jgi:hypothetical protein